MIHTIYSNCYEVLQAALIENISCDIKNLIKNPLGIFKKIPVISPSTAVDIALSHAFADKFSANPGVEFISLFEWLQPFVGTTFMQESQGSSLVWQIWWALTNPEFIKQMEDAPDGAAERLLNYIKPTGYTQQDNMRLLDFCTRLSNLYTTYATYRVDWLINWMTGQELKNQEKAKILSEQPDYYWQKELWRYIDKNNSSHDIESLKTLFDTIESFSFPEDMIGKTYHLFMPFTIPPLALPYIAAFAKDGSPDLWLYILNPSEEFWFDSNSLPSKLFDWKKAPDDVALRYLVKNAASTRAMIDRLYRFINADEVKPIEAYSDEIESKVAAKGPPIKRQKIYELQDFKLSTVTDIQSVFWEWSANSYLHKFQNSILELDSKLLPDKPIEGDESLKLFKAPTFIRELEGIVDWLHARFKADPSLQPSDVLVAVPDIEKAAPEIDGVMGGLSDDLHLPWKIMDSSVIGTELTAKAIVDFGYLISSSFDKDDFLEWLELPINQARWQLSLSDISILSSWLKAAGFLNGLTDKDLESRGLKDEDYSLERAIERLTMGYFFNTSERQPCGDVLAIFGTEINGFDKVSDERGRLFKTLLAVAEQLKMAREQFLALKDGATPQQWDETINEWIYAFFTLPKAPQELISFRSTLIRVIEAMKAGLPADTKVPFEVLWRLIENRLSIAKAYARQAGAITFAPISAIRGLPFKIIVAAGLDEDSGFPGRSSFSEFDQMGVDELKRKGDRDSRNDNRARFIDLLLAARKHLVLSYTIGTDAMQESNPSTVVEGFKEYFLSNAGKNADDIWKTIEVQIPLNSFSRGNFETTESKTWLSPRKTVRNSVVQAINSQYSLNEDIFVDSGIPDSAMAAPIILKHELPAQVLIDFFNDPEKFAIKKFGLPHSEGSYDKKSEFSWLPDESSLAGSIRFRKIRSDLENSPEWNDKDKRKEPAIRRGTLDPAYGVKDVREYAATQEIDLVNDSLEYCQSALSGGTKQTMSISIQLSDETQSKTGLVAVTDTYNDCYVTPHEPLKLFNTANTDSARRRAGLRHIIWHASGKPDVRSILLTKGEDKKGLLDMANLPSEKTEELVNVLVEIFAEARKHGASVVGSSPNPTLWRGIDNDELATKSEKFTGDLDKLINNPKGKTKKTHIPYIDVLIGSAKALRDTLRSTLQNVSEDQK